MADKLRVTQGGEIYIDGVLRMVGAPVTTVGDRHTSGLEGMVMRVESGELDPSDADFHKKFLESSGFFRDQDGVWRKPSPSGSSGSN